MIRIAICDDEANIRAWLSSLVRAQPYPCEIVECRTIPLDSIYCIESRDHKVVLHLRDGEFACYAKIRNLELELQGRVFRIHKGYLVNLSYVDGYSKTEVTLTSGKAVFVPSRLLQDRLLIASDQYSRLQRDNPKNCVNLQSGVGGMSCGEQYV